MPIGDGKYSGMIDSEAITSALFSRGVICGIASLHWQVTKGK